ncbi:hypothetical protein LCGC14_2206680 [marine sediment metagenome]|uniref:Uncharacterized protein n=1 Tax=marine sediment metagenome TaxID=412755 RepID=A0A0F9DFB1_9ZZZZ
MSNLELQKRDAEATVHNILLFDMKLGDKSATLKETKVYLEHMTRKQGMGDLFVAIMGITKN